MLKQNLKKFWHFIWEEDSIWSWLANIVIAFILIKYVIFPVLGFALGSTYPVVAVVSSSMEHDGNFDSWWNSPAICDNKQCTQGDFYSRLNITKDEFSNFRFRNGFNKGDVMVLTSTKNINVGDTIVFFTNTGRPIIHRVISTNPLQTKGDHNQAQIVSSDFSEKDISKQVLIGKASLRVPFIGYVKIIFVSILSLFGIQVS